MTKTPIKKTALRGHVLSLVLVIGLVFSAAARANEDDAPMVIPDTPAAIWQMIDPEMVEMTDLIEAGTLEELHHHAFAVRDLVLALPEHSGFLSADALTQVKSNGKFVAVLADRLDEAGDSNNKAAAESNFEKLETILISIRKNYPAPRSQ